MAQHLRVLLVEDSKVLTERLTEAIRQIPQVELIGTADTERRRWRPRSATRST